MADLMPGIPSVPGDETTWTAFVDQFETLKRGDIPLSLTNWDSLTTVPAIAAGAGIEIAGATYRFTVESLISDEAGLVAGTVYVVIKTADPTVNEATAYFTNVAPEWRDDLNGWYNTTGVNRYTGHATDWDGAASYTQKRLFTVAGAGGDACNIRSDGKITGPSAEFTGRIGCGYINSDNVNLRTKVIKTERVAADAGVPHGLVANKILAMSAMGYEHDNDKWVVVGAGPGPPTGPQSGDSFGSWDAVNVYVSNQGTGVTTINILLSHEV